MAVLLHASQGTFHLQCLDGAHDGLLGATGGSEGTWRLPWPWSVSSSSPAYKLFFLTSFPDVGSLPTYFSSDVSGRRWILRGNMLLQVISLCRSSGKLRNMGRMLSFRKRSVGRDEVQSGQVQITFITLSRAGHGFIGERKELGIWSWSFHLTSQALAWKVHVLCGTLAVLWLQKASRLELNLPVSASLQPGCMLFGLALQIHVKTYSVCCWYPNRRSFQEQHEKALLVLLTPQLVQFARRMLRSWQHLRGCWFPSAYELGVVLMCLTSTAWWWFCCPSNERLVTPGSDGRFHIRLLCCRDTGQPAQRCASCFLMRVISVII